MGLTVDRPVGSPADVVELEYCSAIRQTDLSRRLRTNGSLSAADVRLHLVSRHGVRFRVGGGDDQDDDQDGREITRSILVELAGGHEYEIEVLKGEDDDDDEDEEMSDGGSCSDGGAPPGRGGSSSSSPSKSRFGSLFGGGGGAAATTTATATATKKGGGGDGGGGSPPPSPVFVAVRKTTPLDMVQQTAMLLIPHLRRIQVERRRRQEEEADGGAGAGRHRGRSWRSFRRPSVKKKDVAATAAAAAAAKAVEFQQDMEEESQRGGGDEQDAREKEKGQHGERGGGDRSISDDGQKPRGTGGEAIEPVLALILEEAGLEYGVELTADVVRAILKAFGEDHWPDDVVREMVAQASSGRCVVGGGGGDPKSAATPPPPPSEVPVLDGATLLRALTADTWACDVDLEDSPTTIFEDVNSDPVVVAEQQHHGQGGLGGISRRRLSILRSPSRRRQDEDATAGATEIPSPLRRDFTADSIDYTADTYVSFSWTILIWFTVVSTFFSYLFSAVSTGQTLACMRVTVPGFGCRVGQAITDWLVTFLQLTVLGFLFLSLGTLGNSTYFHGRSRLISGACILASMAVIIFTTVLSYAYGIRTVAFSTVKNKNYRPLYIATLVCGTIVLVLQLVQLVRIVLPTLLPPVFDGLASSAKRLEQQTKRASRYKVNRMVKNALDCHSAEGRRFTLGSEEFKLEQPGSSQSLMSKALCNYNARISAREEIGGFCWVIRNFWFGSKLIQEEGVFIFPRLLWTNLGQVFVIIALLYLWFYASNYIRTAPEDELDGFSRHDLQVTLSVGAVFGLAAACGNAVLYVPSAVSTFFRLRGGIIPTLRDNRSFHPFRFAQDQVALLFGSTFWGTAITGLVVWGFFSVITFLLVWEPTREFSLDIVANLIGILSTVLLKLVFLQLLRFSFYGGYYRRRPVAVNVMNAILECWYLGLSIAVVGMRAFKLLCLSVFYIGRTDVQFLSPGVGRLFGAIDLDNLPLAFRKDVIIHEAHRHPYAERWAYLYLLKLRYKDRFGTRAGAAWRILYTLALMPWMRKYRVHPPSDRRPRRSSMFESDNGIGGTGRGDGDIDDILLEKRALQLEVDALREDSRRVVELEGEVRRLRRSVVVLRERLEI